MASATSGFRGARDPSPTLGRLPALVAMTRPSQIALIGLVLANGILLGRWRTGGATGDPWSLALAAVLVILAAAAVHLANEAADHETDRLAERTRFSGGSGALAASGMRPRVPLRLGQGLAVVVVVASVLATAVGTLPPVALGLLVAGLAGGLMYSLPPIAAMRRGWGEPLNALLGAMLLPLFGVAVATGTFGPLDVVAFAPFLAVVFASVMATAWPDRRADAATGKATMQVRLRPKDLRRIHAGASAAFVALVVLSAAAGAMPLALTALLVTPALVVGMARYTRQDSPLPNVAAMVGTAAITAVTLVVAISSGIVS